MEIVDDKNLNQRNYEIGQNEGWVQNGWTFLFAMQINHIEDIFPDLNKINSHHEYLEIVIKWEKRMKKILLFLCMYILVQLVTPSPS